MLDSSHRASEESATDVSLSNSHIPGGISTRPTNMDGETDSVAADDIVAGGPPEGVVIGGPAVGIPRGDYGMGVVPGVPVPTREWTQSLTNYDMHTPLCEYSFRQPTSIV